MTKYETSAHGEMMREELRVAWADPDWEARQNLESMTSSELFDAWLDYEGIIGYGDKIIGQLRKSGFLVMEPDDLIRIFEENRKQLAMLCGRASLLLQFPGDPEQLLKDLVAFGKSCGAYKEERDGKEG